jgi:hypothetical protein
VYESQVTQTYRRLFRRRESLISRGNILGALEDNTLSLTRCFIVLWCLPEHIVKLIDNAHLDFRNPSYINADLLFTFPLLAKTHSRLRKHFSAYLIRKHPILKSRLHIKRYPTRESKKIGSISRATTDSSTNLQYQTGTTEIIFKNSLPMT